MTTDMNPAALVLARTALDRLTRSAAVDSLDDFLRSDRQSLLIVDCSGSMAGRLEATPAQHAAGEEGTRKIDALRLAADGLRGELGLPVVALGASGADVQVVERIPEPCDMTPMHLAIDFARTEGADHIILVTDGLPDSERLALAAAAQFGHPIDVFYIGDGGDKGALFAAKIAKLTGGKANVDDLSNPKALGGKIRLLLGAGTPAPDADAAIILGDGRS